MPDRETRTFVVVGDQLRVDPTSTAEIISEGGWILPGLVDVHTHAGTETPDDKFDDDVMVQHLTQHRDAGVLVVRMPGSAARIPRWVDTEPDLPRVYSAGRWLATPERFFPGYGRDVSEADLPQAAVEEALASSGWCKVIGDWMPDRPAVPLDVLKNVVLEVHAVGGRVAVHCQTAEGCYNAVSAGADSLEHGMHLDHALLEQMAVQKTALVPTLTTFSRIPDRYRDQEPSPRSTWLVSGWKGMLSTVRAAHDAGVTVLAGTDIVPFGRIVDEVGWLIRAGLPTETAIGAASWTARSWLGLRSLADGAPADLVIYDEDPTVNPRILTQPARIILKGRIVG
ncbi:amidohydrolase family protein [Amycolatopsis keratiniphila]|uniref:amidohydrolase family protein n=1 Tax=Amycolatopsis keratiniphila TaxID=129921 RepID=UPI0033C3D621